MYEGKRYLGKAAEHISVRRNGGPMTAGEWLTRESPVALRDGILVHQRSALTYATIETGDEVVDSSGQRWVAVEVQSSASGEQHTLFDVRLAEAD